MTIIITLITTIAYGTRGSNTYCISVITLGLFWFLKQLWVAVYLMFVPRLWRLLQKGKQCQRMGSSLGSFFPNAICTHRGRKKVLFQTAFILDDVFKACMKSPVIENERTKDRPRIAQRLGCSYRSDHLALAQSTRLEASGS